MSKTFKTIIPELVTFDTELNNLSSFYLSESFNFYQPQTKKEKFHYSLIIKKDIAIPDSYDFRWGYYFKKGNCWYYHRKIFKGISLKFKYDLKNKIFYFNRIYSIIPFNIGGIFPVGEHISDFINLDLFLNDYHIFLGCAYQKNNRNICLIGPSYNGKTSLINKALKNNSKYIAEEKLIINFEENKVYPNGPHWKNIFRLPNRRLSIPKGQIINCSEKIDSLTLLQNSLDSGNYKPRKKNLFEYMFICSLIFLNNNFLRSFIVEEGLSDFIMKKIDDIKKIKKYSFQNVHNFKYAID